MRLHASSQLRSKPSQNVIGHNGSRTVQLMSLSAVVVTKPSFNSPSIAIDLFPIQSAFFPFENEA